MTVLTQIANQASGLDVRDTLNDTILQVKSPRDRRRVTALGDSRIAAIYNDVAFQIYGTRSPLSVANNLMGSRMVIQETFGKSGDRTDHLFARLDAVLATRAGVLYLQAGVNDIGAVASGSTPYTFNHAVTNELVTISNVAAVAARNLIEISNRAKAAGIHVVIEQETGGQAVNSAEKMAALHELRNLLSNYARSTAGVTLHDAMGIIMQQTAATVLFRTGYNYDETHLGPRGAYYWAKSLAPVLDRIIPFHPSPLIVNGTEVLANGRRQLITNPIFTTATGGTLGSGTTGTVPSGWSANVTGGTTVTVGTVADPGGLGNDVTMDITYTAANGLARLDQAFSGNGAGAYPAALQAGDEVEAFAKVELLGTPDVVSAAFLYASVNTGSGGSSKDYMDGFTIGNSSNLGPSEGHIKTLKAPRFVIPAAVGAFPFLTVSARFAGAGAGTASVRIHQIGLRRVN